MANEQRKGKSRIHIDLPTEIHKDVKALALHKNTSVTSVVIGALVDAINKEKDVLRVYRTVR